MDNYIPIVANWFFKAGGAAGGSYYLSYGLLGVAGTLPASSGGLSIMAGLNTTIIGG